jgi:hypothetical protein
VYFVTQEIQGALKIVRRAQANRENTRNSAPMMLDFAEQKRGGGLVYDSASSTVQNTNNGESLRGTSSTCWLRASIIEGDERRHLYR